MSWNMNSEFQARIGRTICPLVAAVVLGSAVFWMMFVRVVQHAGIIASLDILIKNQKELIADVLPLPACLLESYLTIVQIVRSSHASDPEALELKLKSLQAEFETRLADLNERLPRGLMRDLMLKKSSEPARRLFAIASERLLPLLKEREHEQAESIVNNEISAAYCQYRNAIDELVRLVRTQSDQAEQSIALERSVTLLPHLTEVALLLVAMILAVLGWPFEIVRLRAVTPAELMAVGRQFEKELPKLNQSMIRADL